MNERMLKYAKQRFANTYDSIDFKVSKDFEGVNYLILKNESGKDIIFLIDKEITKDVFSAAYSKAKSKKNNHAINDIGFLFYKDGKTYFRTAAPTDGYKTIKGLSLKYYTGRMNKMIKFRPEERLIFEKYRHTINYYQPESENLEEAIVSFEFDNVRADYSHLGEKRFKPRNTDLKRNYIWTREYEEAGNLKLVNGIIRGESSLSLH